MSDDTQDKDIVVNAANAGNLATLTQALKAADLVATYKGIGPFTFFAPTDEAFRKLPKGVLEALLHDKEKLAALINGHVVREAVSAQALKAREARSIQGNVLHLVARDAGFLVNGARVSKESIEACNGTIHPIDTVMLSRAS